MKPILPTVGLTLSCLTAPSTMGPKTNTSSQISDTCALARGREKDSIGTLLHLLANKQFYWRKSLRMHFSNPCLLTFPTPLAHAPVPWHLVDVLHSNCIHMHHGVQAMPDSRVRSCSWQACERGIWYCSGWGHEVQRDKLGRLDIQ